MAFITIRSPPAADALTELTAEQRPRSSRTGPTSDCCPSRLQMWAPWILFVQICKRYSSPPGKQGLTTLSFWISPMGELRLLCHCLRKDDLSFPDVSRLVRKVLLRTESEFWPVHWMLDDDDDDDFDDRCLMVIDCCKQTAPFSWMYHTTWDVSPIEMEERAATFCS